MDQIDELRSPVEAQYPVLPMALQEQAFLDRLRRHVDQRHGVHLACAGVMRADAGGIEYRHHFVERVADQRPGAAQANVVRAEVLVPMHHDRPEFGQAGANAVGALALLAPVGARQQPRPVEQALERGIDFLTKDDAPRIRQQQRITRPRDLIVEQLHLGGGHTDQLFVPLHALAQRRGLDHRGRAVAVGGQVVAARAADPRACDAGRSYSAASGAVTAARSHAGRIDRAHDLISVSNQYPRSHS